MPYEYLKMITFAEFVISILLSIYGIKYHYNQIIQSKAPEKEDVILIANRNSLIIIASLFLNIIVNAIFLVNSNDIIPKYHYVITLLLSNIFFIILLMFISKKKIK